LKFWIWPNGWNNCFDLFWVLSDLGSTKFGNSFHNKSSKSSSVYSQIRDVTPTQMLPNSIPIPSTSTSESGVTFNGVLAKFYSQFNLLITVKEYCYVRRDLSNTPLVLMLTEIQGHVGIRLPTTTEKNSKKWKQGNRLEIVLV